MANSRYYANLARQGYDRDPYSGMAFPQQSPPAPARPSALPPALGVQRTSYGSFNPDYYSNLARQGYTRDPYSGAELLGKKFAPGGGGVKEAADAATAASSGKPAGGIGLSGGNPFSLWSTVPESFVNDILAGRSPTALQPPSVHPFDMQKSDPEEIEQAIQYYDTTGDLMSSTWLKGLLLRKQM